MHPLLRKSLSLQEGFSIVSGWVLGCRTLQGHKASTELNQDTYAQLSQESRDPAWKVEEGCADNPRNAQSPCFFPDRPELFAPVIGLASLRSDGVSLCGSVVPHVPGLHWSTQRFCLNMPKQPFLMARRIWKWSKFTVG